MSANSTTVSTKKDYSWAEKGKWVGIVLSGLTALGLFIASFVSTTGFLGSKDDWNLIQPQITKVLILTLIGTAALGLAVIMYFIQDPANVMYFIILISILSLGLSYTAVAIAAITK
jgi:hypothetical protein